MAGDPLKNALNFIQLMTLFENNEGDEMEGLKEYTLLKFRAALFDLLAREEEATDITELIDEMLLILCETMGFSGIALISRNYRANQYVVEQCTDRSIHLDNILVSLEETLQSVEGDPLDSDILCTDFQHQHAYIISLETKAKPTYLYIISKKETSTYSLSWWKEIQVECSKFLNRLYHQEHRAHQEQRYEQLYQVTNKFHSSMNMSDILYQIIHTLETVYPHFTYFLLLSHDINNPHNLPIKHLHYEGDQFDENAMKAYVSGKVQIHSEVSHSMLNAPLIGKQGIYGVLQVRAAGKVNMPEDEIKFISLLGITAGSALENAQLYQQSKRVIEDLKLINETSHQLNSNLRLADTIHYMSTQITSFFNASAVGFVLFSQNRKSKVLPGSTSFFFTPGIYQYVDFIYEKFLVEHDALFINDATLQMSYKDLPFCSIMAVPMIQNERVTGAAIVLHEKPYFFSFDNFKLLQSLIHHSTLAFTNSMLREELEKLVVTDHLTKLFSRGYLDDKIKDSMVQDPYGTFILVDIDNFKRINDTYGHQIGDQVIIQIANIIKSNIRAKDIGARWGGEELALYLPSVSLEAGILIGNRLLQKVREQTNPKTTISCGVSFWKNEAEDPDTAQQLFHRADKALYQAKNQGKNQLVVQKSRV